MPCQHTHNPDLLDDEHELLSVSVLLALSASLLSTQQEVQTDPAASQSRGWQIRNYDDQTTRHLYCANWSPEIEDAKGCQSGLYNELRGPCALDFPSSVHVCKYRMHLRWMQTR